MPVSSIDATYQGQVEYTAGPEAKTINWNDSIRTQATGTLSTTYSSNSLVSNAVGVYNLLTKGAYYAGCYRTFLFFNVSSITSLYTITAATLKVLGYVNNTGGVIPVASTAWNGNGSSSVLFTADYSNITFATTYASAITSWSTSAYNDFSLNATAISAMNSNGYLNCALINDTYDQANGSLTVGTSEYNGVEFLDGVNDIKVSLTYSSAGYGNNINGVSSASIVAVNEVATASIITVNEA